MSTLPPRPSPVPTVGRGLSSPDGRHWWDGHTWVDANSHPNPAAYRAPGPAFTWGWLLALSPLALLLVAPAYLGVHRMAPVPEMAGDRDGWALLALAAYGVTLLMTLAGFVFDRVALARHGRRASWPWLAALVLLWPVAVPAYLVARIARTGTAVVALLGWCTAWMVVLVMTIGAHWFGWLTASGWNAADLEEDLAFRVSSVDLYVEAEDVRCPDDAWYLIDSSLTCRVTPEGVAADAFDVHVTLDEYYDYTWKRSGSQPVHG